MNLPGGHTHTRSAQFDDSQQSLLLIRNSLKPYGNVKDPARSLLIRASLLISLNTRSDRVCQIYLVEFVICLKPLLNNTPNKALIF